MWQILFTGTQLLQQCGMGRCSSIRVHEAKIVFSKHIKPAELRTETEL